MTAAAPQAAIAPRDSLADISSDIDLFSDAALQDPYPYYKQLRDLGPAAYLSRHGVYFLGRYEQVRAALRDWQTFSSAQGAGLNDTINNAWSEALICNDPPKHTEMRKLFTERLGPRHLKDIEDVIHRRAQEMVSKLVAQGCFDGATDVAQDLPINVIADLIGWPEDVRGGLINLALGGFDACGPESSPRTQAAFPKLDKLMAFIADIYDQDRLTPGGFGSTVADAAKRGEIPREAAIGLLAGYVIAAFDTTINAIASGLWLFAQHPEQWALLRQDPSLIPAAFLEIVRLETPLQNLSRVTTRDVDLGEGVTIPAGSRVVVSYASANRDERHYVDPDRFDVKRNPIDHLGFGLATHTCAGQALAKLEGLAVFSALAKEVKGFAMTAPAQRELTNITRGFRSLPMQVL